ncbi:MAG TPA: 30S ribosomal protein S16 [Candidatus Kaiserbacteria bacterium]|nr:30S ribosomal protein S16 [Candidatus Kaiserbacteria bacterium]
MLMIRFQRIGRKNDAAFRIVVTEKTSGPKSGKHVDLIGSYNPKTKAVSIDAQSAQKWISQGAQVSPSVHNLFVKEGIISSKKINVLPKKSPILKESAEELNKESAVAKEETPPTQQEDKETQKEDTQEPSQQSVAEPGTEDASSTEEKEAQPVA